MSGLTLDLLPLEILARICEFIESVHRPSLAALAQTCQRTHHTASGLLFRVIQFDVSCRDGLLEDAEDCLATLERTGYANQVRRLIIYGIVPYGDEHDHRRHYQDHRWHRPRLTPSWPADVEEREIREPPDEVLSRPYPILDDEDRLTVYKTDQNWSPLARLLQQLPGLEDLIYMCPGQFPPCLLTTLHQHRPTCRLHIHNFKLRSLGDAVPDAHEMALIRSPCLYNVQQWFDNSCGLDMDDARLVHHAEAVVRMVARLAGNLRCASIKRPSDFPYLESDPPTHLPVWKGFALASRDPLPAIKASIRSLRMLGFNQRLVQDWDQSTDFSLIRDLELRDPFDAAAIEFLCDCCSFTRLEQLYIFLRKGRVPRTQAVVDDYPLKSYYEAVVRFLQMQNGISKLGIFAWTPHVPLGLVLGSKLVTLRLHPTGADYLTSTDVETIAKSCPLLEDLSICIHRSKGDSVEVATYRALGVLKRLRYLYLKLETSPPALWLTGETGHRALDSPVESSFSDFDCEYSDDYAPFRKGHVRDAFINRAVDESLAREIFRTICLGSGSGMPTKLSQLTIHLSMARQFHHGPSGSIVNHVRYVGKEWLVRRNPRDDQPNTLIAEATPLSLRRKPRIYESVESNLIFRQIWPAKEDESDWSGDWHSFPLKL